jgi:energy-coupling factor transport system ATP-binding protein
MAETLARPRADRGDVREKPAHPRPAGDGIARFAELTYSYPVTAAPALVGIDLVLQPGLTLVAGGSASGKSSLLRVLNGLVPHFHGGSIRGGALVLGESVLRTPTRRLSRQVGFVFQDPEAQFVFNTVVHEVAFGLENLAVPRPQISDRVDEALHAVGVGHLRHRRLPELSGGERQRVALASAMAMRPTLLALDEPTSQLDAAGADALISACVALSRAGTSLAIAEHRIDRLLPEADNLLVMHHGRAIGPAEPAALLDRLPFPPAIVELGRRLGWDPPPMSIAGARALAPRLRPNSAEPARPPAGPVAWELRGAEIGPSRQPILADLDLGGAAGEVVVLVGANGSGKTTLLRAIAGLIPTLSGRATRRPGRIAYLPQDPSIVLHRATVLDEVQLTLSRAGGGERAEVLLADLGLLGVAGRYPRDLSGGERQRAAIAAIVAGSPSLVLLDEPTRGMDGDARKALATVISGLRDGSSAVVLATHDLDLAARVADRVIELDEGTARDLGDPAQALSGESSIATQVGRLYPGGPVTVEGVLARL